MMPASRPEVERVGDGFVFTWKDLPIQVSVTRLHEGHDTLVGYVTFQNERGGHLLSDQINLLSGRTRASTAKQLMGRFNSVPWPDVLEQIGTIVPREWWRQEPMVLAVPRPRVGDPYALGPFVLKDKSNLFYGDGGSCKTTLVQAMMLSMSSGHPVLPGTIPVGKIPVGIFDWEEERTDFEDRLSRLMRGADLAEPGPLYYRPMPLSIHDSIPYMKGEVERLKLKALCIDSFGLAAGQKPEESDAAIRVFAAVRALRPMTSIVVHHVPKAERQLDGPASPYGSVYIRNMTRLGWEVKQQNEDEKGPPLICLRADKFNYGPKNQTFGFTVHFEPDRIRFERTEVTLEQRTAKSRVIAVIKGMGETTYRQIFEQTSIDTDVIGVICRRLQRQGLVIIVTSNPEGGRGKEAVVKWVF
jgi:hypothetical protein